MQELAFDLARTRALRDKHRPSTKALQRAADAMVVLASDPAAMPQHPNVDLTAAAAAAVHGASSSMVLLEVQALAAAAAAADMS